MRHIHQAGHDNQIIRKLPQGADNQPHDSYSHRPSAALLRPSELDGTSKCHQSGGNQPNPKAMIERASKLFPEREHIAAAAIWQQILASIENKLGLNSLDVAISLSQLHLLLSEQDQHAAAEPFCRRALSIREKVLGPDHPVKQIWITVDRRGSRAIKYRHHLTAISNYFFRSLSAVIGMMTEKIAGLCGET
jgi:hypothetical protein